MSLLSFFRGCKECLSMCFCVKEMKDEVKMRCTLNQSNGIDFCNKVKAIPRVWDKNLEQILVSDQSNLLASSTVHYKQFVCVFFLCYADNCFLAILHYNI